MDQCKLVEHVRHKLGECGEMDVVTQLGKQGHSSQVSSKLLEKINKQTLAQNQLFAN